MHWPIFKHEKCCYSGFFARLQSVVAGKYLLDDLYITILTDGSKGKMSIKKTLKYYWLKKTNILIGLGLTIMLPALVYAWLSGGLALDSAIQDPMLQAWSNPGMLSFPIVVAVVGFIIGVMMLLWVFGGAGDSIDEVLPEHKHD